MTPADAGEQQDAGQPDAAVSGLAIISDADCQPIASWTTRSLAAPFPGLLRERGDIFVVVAETLIVAPAIAPRCRRRSCYLGAHADANAYAIAGQLFPCCCSARGRISVPPG